MKKIFYISIILSLILYIKAQLNEEIQEKCDLSKNCKLPFCNCDSAQIPINLTKTINLSKLPQLVVLTIDDDQLDEKSYQVYRKLLENRKNPNGCSIKATFFVSDTENGTSFCLSRNLYDLKHEIAISTVNYTCPHRRCSPYKDFQPWGYEKWSEEILSMKTRLNRYAGIPLSDINGFRAPLLEPASDMHYRIISANKFLYDSSLILNTDDIIWPFTLNYKINSYLSNNGPINTYINLWELPVPTYLDLENQNMKCLKLWEGHCKFDQSVNGIAKFFRHHFLRAYYNNRAPLVFHLNGNWLKEYEIINMTEIIPNVGYSNKDKTKINLEKKQYKNLDGVIKFIDHTLSNNLDVYFVTAKQAIEWMKLLPRITNENITELINNELFEECRNEKTEFDGECKSLKQINPDYDKELGLLLDDDYDPELRKLLKIDTKEKNLLTDLQSEVLFVNDFVIYFVLSLALVLLMIIIQDKFF